MQCQCEDHRGVGFDSRVIRHCTRIKRGLMVLKLCDASSDARLGTHQCPFMVQTPAPQPDELCLTFQSRNERRLTASHFNHGVNDYRCCLHRIDAKHGLVEEICCGFYRSTCNSVGHDQAVGLTDVADGGVGEGGDIACR